jgi:Ran GTPase-activating protein (RanGAP) involved in mRNA processing and transport
MSDHHSPGTSIQDQLHDLSTFQFPRDADPEDDPTGRAAFRAISEKIDRSSRQTFLRFPSASVLERLEAVDTISFKHCGLGDKGVIALGEALKVNQTITSLDLSDNGLTHQGLASLLKVLPKTVKSLDLSSNRITKGSVICLSSDLMYVKERALKEQQQQAQMLQQAAALAAKDKSIDKESLAALNQAAQQAASNLLNSSMQNAAGSPVTVSPHSGSAGASIGHLLAKNTTLQTLSLKGNKLNDTDTIALAEGLAENATLASLDLSHNDIGAGSATALATILLRAELKEINLEWNKLQNAGAAILIKDGLPVTTVKRIFLGWNGLGDEAAEQLGKVMSGSCGLEELDISNNHIGVKGAEWLAKGIRVSMALVILIIHDNPLRDEGCAALLRAIIDNQTLTIVDMRATGAGKLSAEMIPSVMKSKPPEFKIDMPRSATNPEDDGFF